MLDNENEDWQQEPQKEKKTTPRKMTIPVNPVNNASDSLMTYVSELVWLCQCSQR